MQNISPPAPPRAIALAGPTASGKTGAALALAREHDAEIVSVDSALVYRGMDIGTAKPSREERALVPHHLIDIRDPRDAYSAAEFSQDARRLIAEMQTLLEAFQECATEPRRSGRQVESGSGASQEVKATSILHAVFDIELN